MDYSRVEATIVLSAAVIVGLFSGLLPLCVGVWRRRIGLGLLGCAVCVLAGVALGVILALPIAIIFAAGVYRAPQWDPQTDECGHSFRERRLPIVCTIMFGLALVSAAATWIVLLGLTPIFVESASLQGDKTDFFGNDMQRLYAVGWAALFVGVIGNFLLLLRYRLGLWLGWAYLVWIVSWPAIVYYVLNMPKDKAMELASGPVSASNLALALYCHLAMSVLYGWSLVTYTLWSKPTEAPSPNDPSRVPAWMSQTRFTPERRGGQ